MMTVDDIKARLQQLQNQQAHLQANLNAVDGAMQECEYWLDRVQEKRIDIDGQDGQDKNHLS